MDEVRPPKRVGARRGGAAREPVAGERLGDRLRSLRRQQGWTLSDVSAKTGLAISTLSKVENHKLSLTYNNLEKLAIGFDLDLAEFFTPHTIGGVGARWALSRRGKGRLHETANYAHEYLCAELAGRRMVPFISRIKARSLEEFGELIRHPDEEFFIILEGAIDFHREGNEPLRLRAGDSFYFDCNVAHAAISVGIGDALVLTVIARRSAMAPFPEPTKLT
jgi:transcriptional regulator with XRE-family HTH domain